MDDAKMAGISRPVKSRLNAWPLPAALVVLSALLCINLFSSLKMNGGHFVYALDDAYIHMAMAKNLAIHGVWGVSRYGFTSSSSSIIWTALLGLVYLVAGVNSYAPFILNIIAAAGVVFLSWVNLKDYLTPLETFTTLTAVVVLTPLPAMVFTGMEHNLHILLGVAFLFAITGALVSPEGGGYGRAVLLAPLVVGARYEGLFVVFAACCLLLIKRQTLRAFLLGLSSLALITLYGLYSVHKGWFFLPNSLIIKGGSSLSSLGMDNFMGAPHVTALLALDLALLFFLRGSDASRERTLILLFVPAAALHMVFASVGWFHRYEAYIVTTGILVFALSFKKAVSAKGKKALLAAVLVLAALACKPLFGRGYEAFFNTPRATNNIYSQQYQMGTFLAKYFTGKSVAANDIGAINYLADIRTLDVFGLGTKEVAAARSDKVYSTRTIEELCASHGVELAVVYDSWFGNSAAFPEDWDAVAKWKISDNVVCGNDTVTFYAVNPDTKQPLIRALEEFSPTLPAGCKYGFANHTL